MKITDVKGVPLSIPLKETPPRCLNAEPYSNHVLVKVLTDEGVAGYGEVFTRGASNSICTFIEEGLKPHVLGENPMHVERLWHLMYGTTFRWGRKGITLHCISGVEIALWDIIGKHRNLPIYEMIGGLCKDRIKAYASLPRYRKPEDVATIAGRCVESGYTAVKLHQREIEAVSAVRDAVGSDIAIMVDVNGAWSPKEAAQRAKALEQYGVLWLEEPVSPMDDYDGLCYVKNRTSIMIAAGENEYTHYGFREMIQKGAVDIIQPDVAKSGGILECRKIFALAEAWNLGVATHSFCFGPGLAATLHLSLSNMRSEYVEINPFCLEASFIDPPLRPENGYLTAPDRSGLGIEIDENVVERYSRTGQ